MAIKRFQRPHHELSDGEWIDEVDFEVFLPPCDPAVSLVLQCEGAQELTRYLCRPSALQLLVAWPMGACRPSLDGALERLCR